MSQQIWKRIDVWVRAGLIALVILLGSQVSSGQARPQVAAMQPLLAAQIFDVNCVTLASVTPTYAKLADLATFTIHSADSLVELTFNGRIFVSTFSSGTGAVFELRVDDAASSLGRARANLRTAQAGGGGVQTSITALFTGLEPGEHTASMWVKTSTGGSASQAMVDPGCWTTDVLILKEHIPFGFTFLPSLVKP